MPYSRVEGWSKKTKIPADAFPGGISPIRYRVKENGEFVVYSLGRDAEDDSGEEMGKRYLGDITFTVAPPEVRNRNHILPEATTIQ